jgi:hypothetical protein
MDVEDLRLAVYRSFVAGRPPDVASLSAVTGVRESEVRTGLAELHEQRHVVLAADGVTVLMAHPFTAVPLGFSVLGSRTVWFGGCAWDSFAMPHLLPDDREVLVATTCPACGTPHAWVVNDAEPPPGAQVAHFLVPMAQVWDDVVHSCGHQRLFCSEACVDTWLHDTGNERGYLMDIPTLWRFAAHWYEGRLERGYIRREPSAAKDYFRSVGLRGPFWGLED